MKKALFITLILILTTKLFSAVNNPDEIIRAMKDELRRSMNDLKLESLQKPYYIEYYLTTLNSIHVNAVLGGVTGSSNSKSAELTVNVRVGNYKFDNSNFLDFGFSFFGSGDDEESFKRRTVPLELDYSNLRREIWLATDAAYKQSSEIYSKKLAAIQNRNRTDTTDDFTPMEPESHYDTLNIPIIDIKKYENLCKELSERFKNAPYINASTVGFEYIPETVYYVNSEGSVYIKNKYSSGIEIVAFTQADDGMPLADFFSAYALNPNDLPSKDSLLNGIDILVKNIKTQLSSASLDEPYSGPILYENQAAAQLFAQGFAPNLVTQRQMLTENGVQENERYASFQSKIGGKVLPEFVSVFDQPLTSEIDSTKLCGTFKFDDQGVLAQDVTLVKDGYLKNLLSSRTPTRRVKSSNGHCRGGGAMISNIIISPEADKQKTNSDLRDKLLQLCKDRDLQYGIVVKKVMDQNILFTTLYRTSSGVFPYPNGQGKIILTEAYKLFQDGHEEPFRGCMAVGVTAQSFKDIIEIGNNNYVLNYLAPSVASSFMFGGSQYYQSSISAPDILLEDGEIKQTEDDYPKPPLTANPLKIIK